MHHVGSILIPTDLSEFSLTAIDYLARSGEFKKAELYLLHVIDNVPEIGVPNMELHPPLLFKEAEANAKKELERLAHSRLGKSRTVHIVVKHGPPAREIVSFAREHGIDLIVITTHGRTGLAHVLMGSIAEKVTRLSPVPVLSVKPESVLTGLLAQDDVEEQLHLR
jgi:nucleotide-binding universal stress UspA family protein